MRSSKLEVFTHVSPHLKPNRPNVVSRGPALDAEQLTGPCGSVCGLLGAAVVVICGEERLGGAKGTSRSRVSVGACSDPKAGSVRIGKGRGGEMEAAHCSSCR